MMHVLYILWLEECTSQDEAVSNSEEIKPLAISNVELCLAEGINCVREKNFKIL